MKWRALIAQPEVGTVRYPHLKHLDNSGLADTGFAGNVDNLALAILGPAPAFQYQSQFVLAANERAERRRVSLVVRNTLDLGRGATAEDGVAPGSLLGSAAIAPDLLVEPLDLRSRHDPEFALEHLSTAFILPERGAVPPLLQVQSYQSAVDPFLKRVVGEQSESQLNTLVDFPGGKVVLQELRQTRKRLFVQERALRGNPLEKGVFL